MSHDPQSPTDAADFDDDDYDAVCESCGGGIDALDVNVESFELTGKVLCEDCADTALRGDRDE